MISPYKKGEIDWPSIFTDLTVAGYSLAEIQQYTGIPKSTLLSYRNSVATPSHNPGHTLLKFWAQVCEKKPEDAPFTRRHLSAAAFR